MAFCVTGEEAKHEKIFFLLPNLLAADVTGNEVMHTLGECTLRVSRAFKKLIFMKTFARPSSLSVDDERVKVFHFFLLLLPQRPPSGR